LFLTHAVLLLCEAKKSRMIDWTLLAYDKHNAEGRRMGRGLDHFVTDGAKLENHHPHPMEVEMLNHWLSDAQNTEHAGLFPKNM
jgi:hypothetical protein